MPAWTLVDIVIPPRIFGNGIRLEVRPMPILRISGHDNQILQPVLALGIIAVINIESVERDLKVRNLGLRRCGLGLLRAIGESWKNDRGQNSEDDQHQEQLYQSECLLRAVADMGFG